MLSEANAHSYWERSDSFDFAFDLTAGRRGVAALGELAKLWVQHLLSIDVEIEALTELRDATLNWYVGLDSNATRMGDALWRGETLDPAAPEFLVGLYRLTFSRRRASGRSDERIADLSVRRGIRRHDAAAEAAEPRHRAACVPSKRGCKLISTALLRIPVGIVVERHKAKSPWLDFVCRPVSALAGIPAAAPWTVISATADATTYYAGEGVIELHRSETASYRENLVSGAPLLWVICDPPLTR